MKGKTGKRNRSRSILRVLAAASWTAILLVVISPGMLRAQEGGQGTLTVHPGERYQSVVGFGAALAYYEGWLTAHPRKNEIYQAIFGELSLDILRVRNAFDYWDDPNMVDRVQEFTNAAENALGHPIKVLSSSWGPPRYLKSNNDRRNGGTLRYTVDNGTVLFDYAGFAHWWNRSLDEYNAHGVYPDYISLQNEPDFTADWESCRFDPNETINTSDTIAGYDRALAALYDTLLTREKAPAILGPETVGIGYNSVERYVGALDLSRLDGIAHHLYHGVNENNPFTSTDFTKVGGFHPEVPHWQTEYSRGDWFSLAGLIYKSFYDEKVVAYLYWDLIWDGDGLVALDFPWDQNRWTNTNGYTKTKDFYAFKQYSAFIHPGWEMSGHTLTSPEAVAVSFVNPAEDSAACVVINRSDTETISVRLGMEGFIIETSEVYVTSETANCELQGALNDSLLVLAPHSIATVAMTLVPYDPSEDQDPPSVPSGLSVAPVTGYSLMANWNPSTDNVGVAGYRVYLDGTPLGTTTDTTFLIGGLEPATSYEITVSAFDDVPNESIPSQAVATATLEVDTEAPTVPGNLLLQGSTYTTLNLSWDPSSDNVGVAGYHVFTDDVLRDTVLTSACTLENLIPGTTYQITLTAFDSTGNESVPSEPLLASTPALPDTIPPNLQVTDTLHSGELAKVISSEDIMLYVVTEGTQRELGPIREASLDSISVAGRALAEIDLSQLEAGIYWIYGIDTAGNVSLPQEIVILATGLREAARGTPAVYPNPWSRQATLRIQLTGSGPLKLFLVDGTGRVVRIEELGEFPGGTHEVRMDRDGLSGGVYLYRLEQSGKSLYSGRMIIQD